MTIDKIIDILSRCNVNDYLNKKEFSDQGKKFLKEVAQSLGLDKNDYEISVNPGGDGVGADIYLHTDWVYVNLTPHITRLSDWDHFYSRGLEIMYRGCEPSLIEHKRGRKPTRRWDYGCGMNHPNQWTTYKSVAADYDGFVAKLL